MQIQTNPTGFSHRVNSAVIRHSHPPVASSSSSEKGDLFKYQAPSAAKVKAHKILHQVKKVVTREPSPRVYQPPSYREEIDTVEHRHDPSDETPDYKTTKKDDLVLAGLRSHKGFHQWDKKEQAKWKKEVAADKTTMDFDAWITEKNRLAEEERARAARLQRQFDRETREIALGARCQYSRAVQHLIPIPYVPIYI